MLGLLRIPPLPALVILLAIVAFVVYNIVSSGRVQPLEVLILALLLFAVVRNVLRLRNRARGSESQED